MRFPTASEPKGDFSEGFRMTQFPVAKAGAAFQARKRREAFHAVMAAHTPRGSCSTIL